VKKLLILASLILVPLVCFGQTHPHWTQIKNRPISDWVDVTQYGAVPGSTTSQVAAFEAAIAALPNGGTVYIPVGIYRFDTTLTVTQEDIYFRGASMRSTEIVSYVASGPAIHLDIDAAGDASRGKIHFSDMLIRSGNTSLANQGGIYAEGLRNVYWFNLAVERFSYGIYLDTCYYTTLVGCQFRDTGFGVSGTGSNHLSVIGTWFFDCSFSTEGISGAVFDNCDVESAGAAPRFQPVTLGSNGDYRNMRLEKLNFYETSPWITIKGNRNNFVRPNINLTNTEDQKLSRTNPIFKIEGDHNYVELTPIGNLQRWLVVTEQGANYNHIKVPRTGTTITRSGDIRAVDLSGGTNNIVEYTFEGNTARFLSGVATFSGAAEGFGGFYAYPIRSDSLTSPTIYPASNFSRTTIASPSRSLAWQDSDYDSAFFNMEVVSSAADAVLTFATPTVTLATGPVTISFLIKVPSTISSILFSPVGATGGIRVYPSEDEDWQWVTHSYYATAGTPISPFFRIDAAAAVAGTAFEIGMLSIVDGWVPAVVPTTTTASYTTSFSVP
jgi:hypothetical protein